MAQSNIKVLALDLDGTLTNDQKEITPRTRAALDAALARGVTVVLASGRPIAGVTPVARALELGQPGRAGAILAYNGGAIVDCGPGHRVLWQQVLPAPMVPALCRFAAEQNVAIVTYNEEGVVTERPGDPWAQREGFTNKLPMIEVADLAAYVNYPVNKMLITLDPVRLPHVLRAGAERFAGQIDLYPSSPFFIEAVPLGVAKDKSLSLECNLIGLRYEEAKQELDRYLDSCRVKGFKRVRIIHGLGSGALKRMTAEYCKTHSFIDRFEMAGEGEGGAGATVVYLK